MAEVAVAILLEQVKEVVKGHVDLISGAENELDQLQKELGLLKAFLNDAAKKKKEEHHFRALEARIREVVYEVEDTIDTCLTRAIEAKAKNSRRLLSKKKYDLAKEVKLIREQKVLPMFDEAKANFARMEVAAGSAATPDQRSILMTEKPIRQKHIVGFEDEEATIMKYLLEENEDHLDVIPIIGIPGQGKTTLTYKIYENEGLSSRFPIRIWISVSQSPNNRDVFLQICRKFSPSQDMSNLGYDDIVKAATMYLEDVKFLLVLDDLWSVEAWEDIKTILPFKNGKSKVLITSREMAVGSRTSTRGDPHKLRFLTEDESWTLLQYQVFGNEEDCPDELRRTGQIVARNCDGVPLTTIVVGGILSVQLSQQPTTEDIIKEWMTTATNMSSAIKSERVTKSVELSYDRLPNDLRDCFVYLGVFPENYEIPVAMLLRLWIAEGLVPPKDDDKSLEQCAEENLKDLIARNLLKPEKTNHMGKVKTIRVYDIIRDFSIAINDKEKIFKEIKKSNPTEELSAQNPHRLCIRSNLSDFLSGNPKSNSVHSILYFCEKPTKVDPSLINVIPDGFPNLRVLESKSVTFDQFPRKVAKLIHVRYLTLFIDDTINKTYIPSAISELWNLQTLTVHTMTCTIEIKLNIWRMIRLRHLKTTAVLVLDDKHVGGEGNNLQTLDRLSAESCTEAVSKRAKNLKTLGVYGNLAEVFGAKFLENLKHLEKLKLVNTPDDKPLTLPPANSFPPYLKSLTLRHTFLHWQDMSLLANIRTLEALKLKNKAFLGTKWKVSGYNFPRLQLLLIDDTDLVTWEATEDSFPELRFLVLKSCESLIEIPSCIGKGAHLEKLEIERLSTPAVKSAKVIEDAKKRDTTQGKPVVPFVLKMGPVCEQVMRDL